MFYIKRILLSQIAVAGKWNWKNSPTVTLSTTTGISKFADKVDWGEVITNWNIDRPLEFFSRFQQCIPMSRLQDSRLWKAMVEASVKRLIQETMGID